MHTKRAKGRLHRGTVTLIGIGKDGKPLTIVIPDGKSMSPEADAGGPFQMIEQCIWRDPGREAPAGKA